MELTENPMSESMMESLVASSGRRFCCWPVLLIAGVLGLGILLFFFLRAGKTSL
jgi:hypothetical protein